MKPLLLPLLAAALAGSLSASPAFAAELLYFEATQPSGCAVKAITFPTKQERTLFSEKSCPTALIQPDPRLNRFFYVHQGRLRERTDDKVIDAGALPFKVEEGSIFSLWWTRSTDTLSVAFLAAIPDADVIREGSEQVFVRFEGKKYKVEVPEGLPMMALLFDRKGGKWVRREATATTIESEVALGLKALAGMRDNKSDGVNVNELRIRSTCGSSDQLKCEGEDPRLLKLLAKDGYGQMALTTGALTFAIAFGDTAHASSPVYVCADAACAKRTKLAGITENQLSIAKSGNFVVVAAEYSNDAPRVYDMATKSLVWSAPKATSAVWLPE